MPPRHKLRSSPGAAAAAAAAAASSSAATNTGGTKTKWDRHSPQPKQKRLISRRRLFLLCLCLILGLAVLLRSPNRIHWRFLGTTGPQVDLSTSQDTLDDDFELSVVTEPSHPTEASRKQDPPPVNSKTKVNSVAICLAGGLRAFQLTAASITQHLLSAYPQGDVFVYAPLDETSHKIFLLEPESKSLEQGSRHFKESESLQQRSRHFKVKAIKFLAQSPLDQSTKAASLLSSIGSPNGVQGLLQYFQLVEGCYGLITATEEREGFLYDWIVRTRPDGFWMGPPPPLTQLDPRGYTLPAGSDWGGANDRIGITKRALAPQTMRRLSVLSSMVGRVKGRRLNSETGLKAQLLIQRIPARRETFKFCTLTSHRYPWPPKRWEVPVFSMGSAAPLNAAKCRPCVPRLTGPKARRLVESLREDFGLPYRAPGDASPGEEASPGDASSGYDFCDPSGPWGSDWEELYDKAAGRASAEARRRYANMSSDECVRRLGAFLGEVERYEGPSARLLCAMRTWGPLRFSPPLFSSLLNCSSVLYSVLDGGGNRKSPPLAMWERLVSSKTGASALIFWKRLQEPDLKVEPLKVLQARKKCGYGVGVSKWYNPSTIGVFSGDKGSVYPMVGKEIDLSVGNGIDLSVEISKVDVLRVASSSLTELFLQGLAKSASFPVCQLVLQLEQRAEAKAKVVSKVMEKGFELIKCFGKFKSQSCLFVSLTHCS